MKVLFTLTACVLLLSSACSSAEPSVGPGLTDDAGGTPTEPTPPDPTPPDPSARDAAVSDAATDAATDAADAATACSAIANGAPLVDATATTEPLPAGAGGSVASGTYFLTAVTYSPEAGGGVFTPQENWQQTLTLAPGSMVGVSARNGKEMRIAGTYAISGSQITFNETCPAPAVRGPYGYTATGNALSVFVASDNRRLTYTLQP